jgi:hypothetical protein
MGKGSLWGWLAVLLVVAAVVAALISLAALIDPFDWMPPVKAIWRHCEGDCELAHRFHGFWAHAVGNLAYVTVSAGLLLGLVGKAGALREARAKLFSDPGAGKRLRAERRAVAGLAATLAVLGILPFLH